MADLLKAMRRRARALEAAADSDRSEFANQENSAPFQILTCDSSPVGRVQALCSPRARRVLKSNGLMNKLFGVETSVSSQCDNEFSMP